MNFKVKEDLMSEDLDTLNKLGFITHSGCPYIDFTNDKFSIVLNPKITNGLGRAIILFLDEDDDYENNYIEEYTDLFEIWNITNSLIEFGIIEKE